MARMASTRPHAPHTSKQHPRRNRRGGVPTCECRFVHRGKRRVVKRAHARDRRSAPLPTVAHRCSGWSSAASLQWRAHPRPSFPWYAAAPPASTPTARAGRNEGDHSRNSEWRSHDWSTAGEANTDTNKRRTRQKETKREEKKTEKETHKATTTTATTTNTTTSSKQS